MQKRVVLRFKIKGNRLIEVVDNNGLEQLRIFGYNGDKSHHIVATRRNLRDILEALDRYDKEAIANLDEDGII